MFLIRYAQSHLLPSPGCWSCFQVHRHLQQFPVIKMWPYKPSGAGRPESGSVFQYRNIQLQHGLHRVHCGMASIAPALTSNPLRSLQALFSPVETLDSKPQAWGELNQTLTNENQDRGRKLFTIPPHISKCCETYQKPYGFSSHVHSNLELSGCSVKL